MWPSGYDSGGEQEYPMDTIYLITGATGHLGNTIIRMLLEQKQRVRALVLPSDNTQALEGLPVEVFTGNVCDKRSMEPFFHVITPGKVIVIHTAGIVSISSRINPLIYQVNVQGTKNVTDMCVEKKVSRLIYISSVHAIPERKHGETVFETDHFAPEDVVGAYAKTKAEATQYVLDQVRDHELDAVIVQPSGIVGPQDYGNAHMTQMVKDYVSGKLTASVRGGYDFVDVRDVAQGVLSAVEHGHKGQCYILSNRYITVKKMLDMLHQISGQRKIRTVLPLWFAKMTAPFAEMYYRLRKKAPLFTSYSLYTLVSNSKMSHTRADRDLEYTTRDMYRTLTDTVDWQKAHKMTAPPRIRNKLRRA